MADLDPTLAEGLALRDGGHVIRLKWHRMKRRIGDVPFTASVLAEAFALGASCEVDLRVTGEANFAVLHDDTLDRETTGSGRVASAEDAAIRALRMRTPEGGETAEPVLLLDDLAGLASRDAAPGTLVQLDLKEDAPAITEPVVARFAALLAPVADRFVLSGGDWAAVSRLVEAVPGLAAGFDPCDDEALGRLHSAADFDAFVDGALTRAPTASTIYLAYPVILKAAAMGYDIVGAFHAAWRLIDAYTLNTTHPDAAATLRRLVGLKVDQVTTDEPLRLAALYANSETSHA